ncbi:MAG: hypothetical protein IH851_06930 [Armatimonadetes bacterium]|nr:hypothetical protein [Armatimonadota bacterium]
MPNWSARWALLAAASVVAGCTGSGPSPASGDGSENEEPPTLAAAELLPQVLAALQVSGIPPAPLGIEATRSEREEYLLAVEKAVGLLAKLEDSDDLRPSPDPVMAPPFRGDEVMTVGRVLAVELADAIDRSDPERAAAALRAAFRYADFAAGESVAAALSAEGVAETLALGLRSVGRQLDTELTERLTAALHELESAPPVFSTTLQNEIERLDAWHAGVSAMTDPITVDQLIASVAAGTIGRPPVMEALEEAIRDLADERVGDRNTLTARVVSEEAGVAYEEARRVLDAASDRTAVLARWPDPAEHPIATLFLRRMRPWLEAASKLKEVRAESLRLLSLHIRLLASEPPDTLESFGEEAMSPASGLPFEYIRTETGYELARPPHQVSGAGTTG